MLSSYPSTFYVILCYLYFLVLQYDTDATAYFPWGGGNNIGPMLNSLLCPTGAGGRDFN